MTFEQITSSVNKALGEDVIIKIDENAFPKAIVIAAENLVELMDFLQSDSQLYFDSLSCITGLDNGPEANTMEMIYNLYSIPFDHHLMVKVELERENPSIDSLTRLWRTADWQEREVFDMYGVRIKNHPDLRRILMPADWDGYPLRKDYKEQKYYRGIKVEY